MLPTGTRNDSWRRWRRPAAVRSGGPGVLPDAQPLSPAGPDAAGEPHAAAAWLQTTYSVRFNRRHHRSGHLFQGRYKAQLVEADGYARQLVKYIHLNPVRPRDKRKAIRPNESGAWPSTAGAAIGPMRDRSGRRCFPGFAWTGELFWPHAPRGASRVSSSDRADVWARRAFPWETFGKGWSSGARRFGQGAEVAVCGRARRRSGGNGVRRRRDFAGDCLLGGREPDRRVAIWLRVRVGGERMTEVARQYGYGDGSGVHRVVKRLEKEARSDRALSAHMQTWPILCQVSRVDPGSCRVGHVVSSVKS